MTAPEDLKTCLDNAKFCCNELLGSIIPLRNPDHRDDGDLEKEKTEGVTERKSPAVESTEPYKKERVNEEQIEKWSKEKPNCNFGMYPGRVSNNIIVFDIDGDDAIDRLNTNVLQNYQYGIGSALLNTMMVTTGSGGRHYYV